MLAVSTSELWKTYGRIDALKGVSLDVERGQVFGLLGQNGAGKSTLIKILLGIVRKTDGEAFLLGELAGNVGIRARVGYLPEDHQFPGYHTARSLLDMYGMMYNLNRADRLRRIDESLEIVGLRKRMDYKIRTYSKGMKQRLGIAQAIFHDPDVIFLDEPTDGVDPVGRREIRELLEQLRGEGRTVFLNSHLLGEVEVVCDRVAILQAGEIVRQGTVADLTRQANRYVIGLAPDHLFPAEEVARLGYPITVVDGFTELDIPTGKSIDPILELLTAKGLKLRHLVEKKQSLEDVFVRTVDNAEPGTDRRSPRLARPVRAARRDEA